MRASRFAGVFFSVVVSAASLTHGASCHESRAGADRLTALRVCIQENNRDAVGQLLYELGAPFAATQWAAKPPLAWRADQVSKRIRWSRLALSVDPARRHEDADLALTQIQQLLEETRAMTPVDRPMERRLRLDRVSALHSRKQCRAVVDESKILEAEGPLPPFIHKELADCLLELRQPKEARKHYTEALRADPKNPGTRMGYAYAALDMEDARAAYETIDSLAAEHPAPFASRRKNAVPEPSPEWLDGQIAGAIFRLYADQPAEADERLRPKINGAPGLAYLRADSAKIAAGRDKPRWADEELRIAAALASDDFGIQTELANSTLRRRRYAEAQQRYQTLSAQRPDDEAVLRLGRDLAAEKTFLLTTSLSVTDEEGDNTSAPGSNLTANLRLYSPPLAERWRIIGATNRQTSKPQVEGLITRNRFGGGVDYRAPDVMLEAMGWDNNGTQTGGSAGIWGLWDVSDAWRLSASYDYFSNDVPLRALFYGTRGNSVGAGVDFTRSESQSLSASLKSVNFTDNNDRLMFQLSGSQTLVQRPGLNIAFRPELYGSRNSENDVPYFSPTQDGAIQIAFVTEHRIWRRYQRVFSHSLTIGGGLYAQENFPAEGIGDARYQQSYRIDPLTALAWGVGVNRRVYDGDGVRNLTYNISWDQRF